MAEAAVMIASAIEDHLADSHDRENGILPPGRGFPVYAHDRQTEGG